MSRDTFSKHIPVPEFISKNLNNYQLGSEDIGSLLDNLDYCVSTEADGSIWDRKVSLRKITSAVSIEQFLPNLGKPKKKKNDSTDSSDDNVQESCVTWRSEDSKNKFARSPQALIKKKDNSETNRVSRKITRNRRNGNRILHSKAKASPLENVSSTHGISEIKRDPEYPLSEGLFNHSSINIKPSKLVIKESKKMEESHNTCDKHKLTEEKNFTNNELYACTIDDPDDTSLMKMNKENALQTISHLEESMNENKKSEPLLHNEVDVHQLPTNLRNSNNFLPKQEKSGLFTTSSRKHSWINQFELFVANRNSFTELETTFKHDSNSD